MPGDGVGVGGFYGSRPAKAVTSMNRVERGRWKLVKSRSIARNQLPGEV